MSTKQKLEKEKIIEEARAGWHAAGRLEALCVAARELLDHAEPGEPNAIENIGHIAFLLEAGAEMASDILNRFDRIEGKIIPHTG